MDIEFVGSVISLLFWFIMITLSIIVSVYDSLILLLATQDLEEERMKNKALTFSLETQPSHVVPEVKQHDFLLLL